MVSQKTIDKALKRAGEVLSLHVHKNKIESRRKRDLASNLTRDISRMVKEHDIRAYAIIGIGSDGKAYAYWDTGGILPMWAFPATVSQILQRDMESCDVQDDWKPPLTRTQHHETGV